MGCMTKEIEVKFSQSSPWRHIGVVDPLIDMALDGSAWSTSC
jgi:hypothetical protein